MLAQRRIGLAERLLYPRSGLKPKASHTPAAHSHAPHAPRFWVAEPADELDEYRPAQEQVAASVPMLPASGRGLACLRQG